MRKRRKTRYTWLPIQNGRTYVDGGGTGDAAYQQFFLDVSTIGDVVVGCIPIVADLPQGTLGTVESEGIGEIIGNEYVLKRIVGKCHLWLDYINQDPVNPIGLDTVEDAAIAVTAGFFVARAEPSTLDVPIEFAAAGTVAYNPQSADLTRQPWIWRRQWVLGSGGFGPGIVDDLGGNLPGNGILRGRGSFPQNNTNYGSVADGPHIDAKTGRRIRLEDRLWFSLAASTLNGNGFGNPNLKVQVGCVLDCRYLGALRKPKGRSNFA